MRRSMGRKSSARVSPSVIVLGVLLGIGAVLGVLYFAFASQINSLVAGLVEKAEGPSPCETEFRGLRRETPENLAQQFSASALIDAWNCLPRAESDYRLHASFGKALGLLGSEASAALPALAPYAIHEDSSLREGALAGLVGIGAEAVPVLTEALQFQGDESNADPVMVRWDAAKALAQLGTVAEPAIPALLATLTNPEENPNVKLPAAYALRSMGTSALSAVQEAQRYYYELDGISMGEMPVLREINSAMRTLGSEEWYQSPGEGVDLQRIEAENRAEVKDAEEKEPILFDGQPGMDVESVLLETDGSNFIVTVVLTENYSTILDVLAMGMAPVEISIDTDGNPTTGATVWDNPQWAGYDFEIQLQAGVRYRNPDGGDGGWALMGGLQDMEVAGYLSSYAVERLEAGSSFGTTVVSGTDEVHQKRTELLYNRLTAKIPYEEIGIQSGQKIRILIRESQATGTAKDIFLPEVHLTVW